jgi:hypothetical protein
MFQACEIYGGGVLTIEVSGERILGYAVYEERILVYVVYEVKFQVYGAAEGNFQVYEVACHVLQRRVSSESVLENSIHLEGRMIQTPST